MIFITGVAGFIGFHLTKKLLESGQSVVGLDNINDYYDTSLKEARLKILKDITLKKGLDFTFIKGDLENKNLIDSIFKKFKPSKVCHLAAQAGVRYSITNPESYIQSNLIGFFNIINGSKENNVQNLLYASSSSVYGGNNLMPFSEDHSVNHPVSLYGATKKSNELIAHTYSHIFNLPVIGLRFFTVYGPWGRPDMALFLFTKAIIEDKPIKVFNNGDMLRDFTYIDDIVQSLTLLLDKPAESNKNFDAKNPNASISWSPYRIFNIGNSNPTPLLEFIKAIEDCLGKKAKKLYLPMQKGDVPATFSDSSKLFEWIKFKPNTSVKEGVSKFVEWYKYFYKVG